MMEFLSAPVTNGTMLGFVLGYLLFKVIVGD